jgi:DNA repair photolyase
MTALPMAERITVIPELHRDGYDMHLNVSPAVLREGWETEWGTLFEGLGDILPAAVKDQLAAGIILLTHTRKPQDLNLARHPKTEELLWRPAIQEEKVSGSGDVNLRHRARWKRRRLQRFTGLLGAPMPCCRVRHAF